MTKLERTLVDTFLHARWHAYAGLPVCPRCYDGQDLSIARTLPNGLRMHHCRCCRYDFSDVVGTPLQRLRRDTQRDRLVVCALVVLVGSRTEMLWDGRNAGTLSRHTFVTLQKRLSEWSVTSHWRAAMLAQNVTIDQLVERLRSQRVKGIA